MENNLKTEDLDYILKVMSSNCTKSKKLALLKRTLLLNETAAKLEANQKKKNIRSAATYEESNDLIQQYLPVSVIENNTMKELKDVFIETIKSFTYNGRLNIGWEESLKKDIENILVTAYIIGIDSAFEMSQNKLLKDIFIANKDKFFKYGLEEE